MNVFILAGGKSSRFKEDKTLFKIKDKALIEITIEKVRKFSKNITIVAKDIKKYEFLKVNLAEDIPPYFTPLSGIYTSAFYSKKDFFVVGADMPFIKKELMCLLKKSHKKGFITVAFTKDFEPLLGIYPPSVKDLIISLLENKNFSVRELFKSFNVNKILEEDLRKVDENLESFININKKEDLAYMSSL